MSGCGIDSDCVALADGSDTCDAAHGLCYNKTAVPGSPCTTDDGCMLGGICSGGTRFPGGYCQTFGCAPNPTGSTPAVDLCAGAGSACVQRGAPDAPIHACYDGCQFGSDAGALMCLRAGFVCTVSVGQPTREHLPRADRNVTSVRATRRTIGARRVRLGSLAALLLCAAPLHAQQTAPPPVAAAPATPPAAPGVAPPETVVAAPAAPTASSAPAVAAAGRRDRPPPWGRSPPATRRRPPSDHDAVVGHVGVAARRLDPGPLPLALRPGQGCAAGMTSACTVTLGAVGARYWMNRNVALNGYLVLGTGGGSVGAQDRSTPTSASGRSWG